MQIRNNFWILSNLCLNLHNFIESVAILLDSAILEYSRVKTLGGPGTPSSHTAPSLPRSHKTEGFEGPLWVILACPRDVFTGTADSAAGPAGLHDLSQKADT